MPAQALPQSAQVTSVARIKRLCRPGLNLIIVQAAPVTELHLTLTPGENESPVALVRRLAEVLARWDATIVRQMVFGSTPAHRVTLEALKQAFDDPAPPLTWIEGTSYSQHPLAGMQVHAVAGAKIQTVEGDHGAVARVWDNTDATHCVVSGGGPGRTTASPAAQARETFENLQETLGHAGMTMKDVARTWFYLDNILSWYGNFNCVRNDFFARSELRAGSVPASTGVGGRNPAGSALTVAAWAARSHEDTVKIAQVVPSPRQGPAPAYGSAFSRAVEIHSGSFRQLLVSGTASIAPDGTTAHAGDVRAQIELTMQVVGDLLASRQMSFADVSRATAYFKSPAAVAVFTEWLARRGLTTLPAICTCCEICRGDLVFEIELDALQAGG
jgi:enamine deaminase RidA (YjgF/YER057c/UK114 family)